MEKVALEEIFLVKILNICFYNILSKEKNYFIFFLRIEL
jgi:hypothetical protein